MRNVIAGTVLIGLLLNGLTIMDISYPVQNIIKSLILLLAIILDSGSSTLGTSRLLSKATSDFCSTECLLRPR